MKTEKLGEMVNINIADLPNNIHEGDILKYINDKYEIDEEKRIEIEERLNNKMKNLFNN